MMKTIQIILSVWMMLLVAACNINDLEPTLTNDKDVEISLKNLEDLQGIANGMHDRMSVTAYYGRNMQIYGEVRSDNCFANGTSGRFIPEAQMMVSPDNSNGPWEAMYAVIASANIIINADLESLTGDKQKISQIAGQAYIARAMAHFDLLRLYGQQHAGGNLGIPYIKSYTTRELTPVRSTTEENRKAIFEDIDAGLSLMTEAANPKTKQFISTYAGYALKARVALYFKEWEKAKTAAQTVVNSGKFEIAGASDFVNSWKTKNGVNSIFEIAASTTDNLGINGLQYIYRGPTYGDIEVLDNLKTIFDESDVRVAAAMIGYETIAGKQRLRNMGKYPSADFSDNIAIMRFEELVLILAEAKIELGESGALDILNLVPAKRGAILYAEATKANVLLERRKELCFEGFRFDDLARTGRDIPLVDQYRQTHGGPKYGSFKYAFPIPTVEINANSNMVQNDGYK
ncbi:MAG: RagB/SusD family nutrient uptake outer membrane protein [Bacteroidetes bacterium]|nr:MAG: RagB/SusD family nutrient uptake outer membrane protein [Bacteroidota bacterium]